MARLKIWKVDAVLKPKRSAADCYEQGRVNIFKIKQMPHSSNFASPLD